MLRNNFLKNFEIISMSKYIAREASLNPAYHLCDWRLIAVEFVNQHIERYF